MDKLLIVVLGLLLLLVFLYSYKRNKDIFSPLCLFSILQFLQYIPTIFYKTKESNVDFSEADVFLFFIVEIVAIFSLIFGYYIYQKYFNNRHIVYVEYYNKPNGVIPIWTILLIFSVGIYSRIRMILSAGGLAYILNNTQLAYRSSMAGSGYSSILSQLMVVAIIMAMNRLAKIPKEQNGRRIINILLIITMMVLSMFSYLVYSRRSPALEILIYVIFAYHYLIKNIKISDIIKPKVIVVSLLVFLIIIFMPAIRQGNKAKVNVTSLLSELSYFGRDLGTYDHFKNEELWFGKSYYGLFTAVVPSSIMSDKLPIDDGLYLCNMLYGYNITPPIPTSNIPFYNSIPFSTQGSLFANFGIVGVILGEMMLGMIYAKTYKKLKNTKSDYYVIVYQLVIYQLALTTLDIVQTLIPLLVARLVYVIYKGMRIKKEYIE